MTETEFKDNLVELNRIRHDLDRFKSHQDRLPINEKESFYLEYCLKKVNQFINEINNYSDSQKEYHKSSLEKYQKDKIAFEKELNRR